MPDCHRNGLVVFFFGGGLGKKLALLFDKSCFFFVAVLSLCRIRSACK